MNKPKGIDPTQAREKARSGQASLVCAYDDDQRCRGILLDGAVTLSQFQASTDQTDKDREIILFCA